MKIEIKEFKVNAKMDKINLKSLLHQKYHVGMSNILVTKESVDARDKKDIKLVYNLIAEVSDETYEKLKTNKFIKPYQDTTSIEYNKWNKTGRPVIVGFGPAGIFAALYLARCNAKPIIIERGSDVDTRVKKVEEFLKNKNLDESTNVQFGEGGAGTFSDGKLTTSLNDEYIKWIIEEFVKHGAPEEVKYESMPHIGTDYLRDVIKNIREEIKSLGGKFYFNSCLNKIEHSNDKLLISTNTGIKLVCEDLILALGHSARDTIKYLHSIGLEMEAKSFSMGVRIEHKREDINKIQYGSLYKKLKPAYYKLSCHLKDRSVYTFCMCPGGEVMASQSEANTILTNGMSRRDRNMENSNSGLLVNVNPEDFYKTSVLDGLDYQEKYEKLAFDIAGDYRAPANLVKEFLEDKVAPAARSVTPSYPHGVIFTDLRKCLPDYVVSSLKEGIKVLDKRMHGFNNPDAVLTGVETRSSCPIRMLRDSETRESNIKGIYPVGEGAGYAGGITSAALDGLKTAIFITKNEK